MKFRIFGTLFVLAVLFGVAVLTSEPSSTPATQSSPPSNDIGFKPININ